MSMVKTISFPVFSSFPIFFVILFTSILLFIYILNDSGIICVMLLLYLILLSIYKVLDVGCLILTIVCGIFICEVRVIYAVLPHIFVQLSNGIVFILSHVLLLHCGLFMFLEFGFNKLRKEDQSQFMDLSLVLMLSFPSSLSFIWTYGSSFFLELSSVPYVAITLMFINHQIAFKMYNNSENESSLSLREEVPTVIAIIQLLVGPFTHILITVVSMFKSSPQWTNIIMDQLMLWSLGILFITLLPTSRFLIHCGSIYQRHVKAAMKSSALICYLMTIPILHIHGIHFHTARLLFVKMCLLAIGLVYVTRQSRRIWPVFVNVTLILIIFIVELPWGIQLLPKTTFFLERIYLGIILIIGSALISLRSLAVASKLSLKSSHTFQISFVILITVFHYTESSLYFVNLVSTVPTIATIICLYVVQLCLSGRLSDFMNAVIDSQLFLKFMVIITHWSNGGTRMDLGPLSYLSGLTLGFIVSYSFRSRVKPHILISIFKLVSLCICFVILRDSVLMFVMYYVTNEQFIVRLSVLQCIGVSCVLDVILNWSTEKGLILTHNNIVRGVLAITSVTFLINTTVPLGVLSFGIYLIITGKEEKWNFLMEIRKSILLSGGFVLIFISLGGPSLLDKVLMFSLIMTLYLLYKLLTQTSVRVLKRFFIKIWIFWSVSWLLELIFGSRDIVQYILVVVLPIVLCLSLSHKNGCLHDNLETSVTIHFDRGVISKIKLMCLAQTILGGLFVQRFQWSSPWVLILPFSLLLLEKYPCTCARQELSSKHINSLSLAVSLCAMFLLISTMVESPLTSSSILQSASELSLQLDMIITLKAWFELVLSSLVGLNHIVMFIISFIALKPHNCVTTTTMANIDVFITIYTIVIPLSLGFLFCSSSVSSAVFALLSFAAGMRFLIF